MNLLTNLWAAKQLNPSSSTTKAHCALLQQQSDRPISWEAREVVTGACCKLAGKSTFWFLLGFFCLVGFFGHCWVFLSK